MVYLLLLHGLFYTNIFSQSNDRIVASVGKYNIYESEFKERFDFSVHPGMLKTSDRLAVKKDFLNQLIAEKLLALKAAESGYDTTALIKDMVTPLDNMYIRDALYTQEVKKKAGYTQEDINYGLAKIKRLLKVKFIYSTSPDEINSLYKLLKAGASFDSLLSLRREASSQQAPREITFGTMEQDIEDSVYSLKPGEYTPPLQSKDGYYILKLVSSEQNTNNRSRELVYDDVRKIVEKRAEYKAYLTYYRNFFNGRSISADKDIFELLAGRFIEIFGRKYPYPETLSDTTKIFIRGGEVTSVLLNLPPGTADKSFIKVAEKPIPVKVFINQLSQEGLFVRDPGGISIRASLSAYIRKFIEDQLLTREGLTKGLDKVPEVKKYTDMWKDCYLAQMVMLNLFDSVKVSEEEAFNFFKQNDGKDIPFEWVNIAEVLTDSLNIVETVLNEISKGRDIKELAGIYTKRDSLKEKGGEFGFFPVTQHGELGRLAANMQTGEIYGPVKLPEGYSVFKVLDKKTAPLSAVSPNTTDYKAAFDELKDQIIMQLSLNKFRKFVNEYNASLARKYGVKINEDVLEKIQNSYLDLVVVRYMGFGGEIFAVPYTEQFSGWYDIWQNKNNITP
jgi:parvulin-like peptidyl-prolyl isomerase